MSHVSLAQFLQQQPTSLKQELAQVIETIAKACINIDDIIKNAAFTGALGSAGNENVQGEVQKKLDVISNDVLIDALSKHPAVAGLASEELDDMTQGQANGDYLVLFDPLDGSSNIDINMCIGTIFSILKAPSAPISNESFYQKGRDQVAAGYVMYGPSVVLALTTGQGVHIFHLDDARKEFFLIQSDVQIAPQTQEFAINTSNQRHWEKPVQRYIDELLAGEIGVRAKDFNMRWVACMVGDVHRILMRGGIFMYPLDTKQPQRGGRLRLMYEANPLSMIIEQAGGQASTGRESILDIQPKDLHQRVAVIVGASDEVERLQSYHLN